MIIFTKGTRAYEIFTYWDRKLAGLIGMRFGDRYTISAQCFRSPCFLCKVIAIPLNWLQKEHFKIAAEIENLDE